MRSMGAVRPTAVSQPSHVLQAEREGAMARIRENVDRARGATDSDDLLAAAGQTSDGQAECGRAGARRTSFELARQSPVVHARLRTHRHEMEVGAWREAGGKRRSRGRHACNGTAGVEVDRAEEAIA
eukprot:CAMPEP_0115874962 /NCGR_PEP_ID=MMETSP0287-20121206/24834_1 /TAXON_ID=412157 /ORGANISM="Chrysochromulina rotalis, Strain UIO044" /LENGTH=126 /DNA_ID=CAMNT_0003330175 /DNA_START=224 /DNA_END=600 /DNA_ORIENTATION=-